MTNTNLKTLPKVCFGPVVITRAVADQLPSSLLMRLLDRHFTNDWGELDDEDAKMNAEAVNACDGSRIMSSYKLPENDEKIWIISCLQSDPELQQSPDHCYTIVLFPSEY